MSLCYCYSFLDSARVNNVETRNNRKPGQVLSFIFHLVKLINPLCRSWTDWESMHPVSIKSLSVAWPVEELNDIFVTDMTELKISWKILTNDFLSTNHMVFNSLEQFLNLTLWFDFNFDTPSERVTSGATFWFRQRITSWFWLFIGFLFRLGWLDWGCGLLSKWFWSRNIACNWGWACTC